MRIPISVQRNIVRYISENNFSNRYIANLVNVSPNTIRKIKNILSETGKTWLSLKDLDDINFNKTLHSTKNKNVSPNKPIPDWLYIHTELQKKDITLELLWQEFKTDNPEGISYSRAAKLYAIWKKKQKLSMRQIHKSGDKFFVDFCGRTVPIINVNSDEVVNAQVFVGTLGASGYIFAYAVASQKVNDWITCHIEAFKYLGGVPKQVIPDNLKSAIIKNSRKGVVVNPAYEELAEHYNFAIVPARPRKPKDKSLAEVSVKIVQRAILAKIRNQKFFTLDELNKTIHKHLEGINSKATRTYPESRFNRLVDIDLPALSPLPENTYEPCNWKYQVKVNEFYQVEWEGHFYSVPYQYAHLYVDLRVSNNMLEIMHQRQRIASHVISSKVGDQTIITAHMPANHQMQNEANPEQLLDWAKSIGPNTYAFVDYNFKELRNYANNLKRIRGLKKWVIENSYYDRLEEACGYALKIKVYALDRIKSIIKHYPDTRLSNTQIATPLTNHRNLRGSSYFQTQGENDAK